MADQAAVDIGFVGIDVEPRPRELAALQSRDQRHVTSHKQAHRRRELQKVVDLALLDVQTAILANQAMNYLTTGKAPGRLGNAHPNIVPYEAFPTADGYLILAVGNDSQFKSFCAVAGLDALPLEGDVSSNGLGSGDALLDDDVDASIGPLATFVTTCVHISGLVLLCVDDDLAAPPQGAFETSLSAARDGAGAAALVVASAAVSICAAAGHETASAALVAGEAPAHR